MRRHRPSAFFLLGRVDDHLFQYFLGVSVLGGRMYSCALANTSFPSRAHNPKVEGSNPSPATKKSQVRAGAEAPALPIWSCFRKFKSCRYNRIVSKELRLRSSQSCSIRRKSEFSFRGVASRWSAWRLHGPTSSRVERYTVTLMMTLKRRALSVTSTFGGRSPRRSFGHARRVRFDS
jgi:hypothetical protein